MAEESSADNVILRAVQLEQERLADVKISELSVPAGLPEIDFIGPVQAGQKVEPFTIRDSHEEAHTFSHRADQNDSRILFRAAPQFQRQRFPPRA
jgi:hypothetical protein